MRGSARAEMAGSRPLDRVRGWQHIDENWLAVRLAYRVPVRDSQDPDSGPSLGLGRPLPGGPVATYQATSKNQSIPLPKNVDELEIINRAFEDPRAACTARSHGRLERRLHVGNTDSAALGFFTTDVAVVHIQSERFQATFKRRSAQARRIPR